jgi:transcription antitermination factor NusG
MEIIENSNRDCGLIAKVPNRHWGFAMVRPRNEKAVMSKLKSRNVPCYLPLLTKHELNTHKKIKPQVPMFCGYVFVCMDFAENRELLADSAVRRVLLFQDSDETQLIRELNVVRKCELLSRERQLEVNEGFFPGDRVICTAGPLKDEEVVIVKRDDAVTMIVNWYCFDRYCAFRYLADELRLL